MSPEIYRVLTARLAAWVSRQPNLRALAIVGSWARGNARPESDLDCIVIADEPKGYRGDLGWLATIAFQDAGYRVVSSNCAAYGQVWSWHVGLEPEAEVEISFAPPEWASIDPVDAGTERIVKDAFQIVIDKNGILEALVAGVAAGRPPSA